MSEHLAYFPDGTKLLAEPMYSLEGDFTGNAQWFENVTKLHN